MDNQKIPSSVSEYEEKLHLLQDNLRPTPKHIDLSEAIGRLEQTRLQLLELLDQIRGTGADTDVLTKTPPAPPPTLEDVLNTGADQIRAVNADMQDHIKQIREVLF